MSLRRNAIAILLLISSCTKPLPVLVGINLDKWKEDKRACQGNRQTMLPAFRREHNKLKGLSEMEVIELLGRPDENELYKRNQKFYSYYISPASDCPDHDLVSDKLVVRFNAMGFAQLVSISTD